MRAPLRQPGRYGFTQFGQLRLGRQDGFYEAKLWTCAHVAHTEGGVVKRLSQSRSLLTHQNRYIRGEALALKVVTVCYIFPARLPLRQPGGFSGRPLRESDGLQE